MYKVFVNDVPIILSTEKDLGKNYISFPIKRVKIKKIIRKVAKGKLGPLNLFHRKEKKLMLHFRKKLPLVRAGGGLVYNTKGEILFIFRKGKWDLPKGKLEKKESIEQAAIREVEEETGVKGLEIVKPLETTYHIFRRGGKFKLKETHWYEMKTSYEGKLIPEENEEIVLAEWKNKEEAIEALSNSYANIQLLFPEYSQLTTR